MDFRGSIVLRRLLADWDTNGHNNFELFNIIKKVQRKKKEKEWRGCLLGKREITLTKRWSLYRSHFIDFGERL